MMPLPISQAGRNGKRHGGGKRWVVREELKDKRTAPALVRGSALSARRTWRFKLLYAIGMRIAELLRAWRFHQEMSVREAAERVGIPGSTYARIEKGYPMSGETFTVILRWMLAD